MRKKELFSLVATVLTALFILPLAILFQSFIPRRQISGDDFFGMSINLDRDPLQTKTLIDELGVTTLLIRFPLWEMDRLDDYLTFIKVFAHKKIVLNVMQDREHIEDLTLLKDDLNRLFTSFMPYVDAFQIGSTINRAKWGFFSVREYLSFYEVAYKLKQKTFSQLTLLGPSVIDFEYHFTVHALFNHFKLKYDVVSALLYVDRRGAPENTQIGYNLLRKIDLLDTLALFSPKSRRKIYITETNWPISNTAPYAPTSEFECVNEDDYTAYMLRYYLLSFASQKVDRVYWHQLIAPGYGLVDSRSGLQKRDAFQAFSTMLSLLKKSSFVSFKSSGGLYLLKVQSDLDFLTVIWSLDPQTKKLEKKIKYQNYLGESFLTDKLSISTHPIYIFEDINEI